MVEKLLCPDCDEWQRYLLGQVGVDEAERLEQHLAGCEACLAAAQGISATDTLLDTVRSEIRTPGPLNPQVDDALIARMCRLRLPSTESSGSADLDETAELARLLNAPLYPDECGRIGPYGILRVLGRGGMGIVFAARQDRPRRQVALKMLHSGARSERDGLERFRAESEMLARLQHPNVVRVLAVGEHEGRPYFTTDYAEGGNLAQKLAASSLPVRQAAALTRVLAQAVHAAHAQGIVHRDLKPSNILLTSLPVMGEGMGVIGLGTPLIADFGLAKLLDISTAATAADRTVTGTVVGTPEYMAPEQAAGHNQEIGPAADIYALGAILYEGLTGRPPFRSANLLETLEQVRTQEPVPPVRLQPKLPRDLQTICLKCLAKEPRRRYESAAALADDLNRFLDGRPIVARPVRIWERLWKWARRRPAVAALLAVSLLAIATVVSGVLIHNAQLQQAAAEARQQRELADARYQAARASMRRMLDRFQYSRVADVPRLQELRRELLEDALVFYDAVLKQADNPDPAVRIDVAAVLRETAGAQYALGQNQAARDNLHRAINLLEALPAEYRDRPESQEQLALCHGYLGTLATGQEAEDHARAAAFQIYERQATDHPDQWQWQNELARAEHSLAHRYQAAGRLAEAERHYGRAVDIRSQLVDTQKGGDTVRFQLAETYQNLGSVYGALKRWPEARAANDRARQFLEPLMDRHPEYRLSLAAVYHNAGDLLSNTGKPAEALPRFIQAVDLAEAVLQLEPQLQEAIDRAYNAHGARAEVYQRLGHWSEAVKDWDRVVALDRRPNSWQRRLWRAVALARAGDHARAAAEAGALEHEPKLLAANVYDLACVYALAVDVARSDASVQPAVAERYAERAMALLRKLHAQGFFEDAGHFKMLATDNDLRALRDRPDFQHLLKR